MFKKYRQLIIGCVIGFTIASLPVLAKNKKIDVFF